VEQPARVGVFGGTFDPVHVGHLIVATELRHTLALDRVLWVPAGRPPHKTAQEISDDAHRLAMLRLALQDDPAFEISTLDVDRRGLSYTADTLAILARDLAPATLVFLMGEDSLRDLPTWHQPGRIAALAELGVALRPGVNADVEAVTAAVPEARGRVRLVPVPLIGVSSSDIRLRVATGAPISYQVPQSVERYIVANALYRS
jgi:nicotinate-nucleotide adenylyltransferase